MIKASAGGGGRGMRVAHNDGSLRSGMKAAIAEAENAFGNGTDYHEKFIENARHVEVQVIGDKPGNVCHLYARDCTMQRRKQTHNEEAPCPVHTRPAAETHWPKPRVTMAPAPSSSSWTRRKSST